MTEPSERDREMAEQWWSETFDPPVEAEELSALWILTNAIARAEGRREAIEECARRIRDLIPGSLDEDEIADELERALAVAQEK